MTENKNDDGGGDNKTSRFNRKRTTKQPRSHTISKLKGLWFAGSDNSIKILQLSFECIQFLL